MKESIFQTSFAMDDDEFSDDEVITSKTSSSTFSQVVEQVTSKTIMSGNEALSKFIKTNWKQPSLNKVESNKKDQGSVLKDPPPWIREMQARKHKLSLRGDEFAKSEEPKQRNVVLRINSVEYDVQPKATTVRNQNNFKVAEEIKSEHSIKTESSEAVKIEKEKTREHSIKTESSETVKIEKEKTPEDVPIVKSQKNEIKVSEPEQVKKTPENIELIETKIQKPTNKIEELNITIPTATPITEEKKIDKKLKEEISVKLQGTINKIDTAIANMNHWKEKIQNEFKEFKESIDKQVIQELQTLLDLKKDLTTLVEDC